MSKGKKILRWAGGLLGGVVVLAVGGLTAASLKTSAKLERKFEAHRVELPVPNPLTEQELAALRAERAKTAPPVAEGETAPDPLAGLDLNQVALEQAIARGEHLVEARYACKACHGNDLAGGVMLDDPPIGNLRGPNLTSGKGGLPADYSVSDWDRIVRHGLKRDGLPAIMPSEDFFLMTDHELSDIIAYVRSLPARDAEVPKVSLGPVGKMLIALGKLPLAAEKLSDHQRAHPRLAPVAADTPEFGAHLAATCTGCHRENLAGGPIPFGPPDWPAAGNLTKHETGLSSWTFEDFEKALIEGKSKGGRLLRAPMSEVVAATRGMTALERKALWTYLLSLRSLPTNP